MDRVYRFGLGVRCNESLAFNDIGRTVSLRRRKSASSLSVSLSVSLSDGRIRTGQIDSDCDSDSDSDHRPATRCHFLHYRPLRALGCSGELVPSPVHRVPPCPPGEGQDKQPGQGLPALFLILLQTDGHALLPRRRLGPVCWRRVHHWLHCPRRIRASNKSRFPFLIPRHCRAR